MTRRCSFCGHTAFMSAGPLRLCRSCRDQLLRLDPRGAAYLWYVAAVRRALFPAGDARS